MCGGALLGRYIGTNFNVNHYSKAKVYAHTSFIVKPDVFFLTIFTFENKEKVKMSHKIVT